MSHDRFRFLVLLAGTAISLAALVFWPGGGSGPSAAVGWPVRLIVTFGLPAAGLTIALLFRQAARIRLLREGLDRFRGTYESIVDAAVVLVISLQLTLLAYLFTGRMWLGPVIAAVLGGVLVFVGNILPRIRPNSAIGIRTPWTLRDESVWRKIHRIGGYAVVFFGLALLAAGVFAFQWTWMILFIGTIVVLVGLPAASYLFWRSGRDRARTGENTASGRKSGFRPGSEV